MTFSESVNQKARVVHGCLLRLRWYLPRSPPPGVRSSKMSFYRFPQLQHGGHVEKHRFKEKERATQAKQCGVNFRVGWLVLGYRHLFSANSGSNISTGLLNWTLKQLYGLVAHWWFSWVTSDLDTVIVIIIFPWRKITKKPHSRISSWMYKNTYTCSLLQVLWMYTVCVKCSQKPYLEYQSRSRNKVYICSNV